MTSILLSLTLNLFAAQAAEVPSASTQPANAGSPIALMTFNIRLGTANDGPNHWQHRREMVFEVLRRHEPDLVGMQEVIRFQMEEILEAVPTYAAFGAAREDGKAKGEYSPILYRKSRFRVLEEDTFWLSERPEEPGSKSWDTACTRVCTWGRFLDVQTGRNFYLFNTHLDHVSQEARQKGVELILQRIRDRKHQDPVFFTGDFNAGEDSPVVRKVNEAGLRDSFRLLHPKAAAAGTFNSWKGLTDGPKIDYIFVSEPVEVRRAAILHDNREGRYPSDHFPVSALVAWK